VAGVVLALTIVLAPTVVAAGSAQGQTYTYGVLHSFTNIPDGTYPLASLVIDAQGNLYGTTPEGGAFGAGTLFRVDTTGEETVLYSFTGGADGGYPYASLVLDAQGKLYGTTSEGGAFGAGTVFTVDTTGEETVLYSFTGGADGGYPNFSPVIFDSVGNLYGTTALGGAAYGVVFELSPVGGAWTETVLYRFTGGTDGEYPSGGLVMDSAGNLDGK